MKPKYQFRMQDLIADIPEDVREASRLVEIWMITNSVTHLGGLQMRNWKCECGHPADDECNRLMERTDKFIKENPL